MPVCDDFAVRRIVMHEDPPGRIVQRRPRVERHRPDGGTAWRDVARSQGDPLANTAVDHTGTCLWGQIGTSTGPLGPGGSYEPPEPIDDWASRW